MRSRGRDRALLLLSLVLLGWVILTAWAVVPAFEQLYAPFASELEWQTRVLFATYRGWFLALVPMAILWMRTPSPGHAAARVLVYGACMCVILGAFGAWAIHQPHVMLKVIAQAGQR